MKISLKWLNEYIDVLDYFENPQPLSDVLTQAGLEVESIEDLSKDLSHVVIGQVVELDKHPDADRLTLCQVDCGEGHLRQIVCGAKNHTKGDRVVVAKPGAVLPGNFAIKLSNVRGIESQGMMCSESELGMAEQSDGILILDLEAPIGESFARYSGRDDIVFDLSVTPNRADCLSHMGLARELACLLERPLRFPEFNLQSSGAFTKSTISLELKASDLCPRYAGRMLRGVQVKESPQWLKQRLERVGLNTINNIVDVTNYVMMEMGQPLHAFDVRNLKGSKIIIDRAKEKEKFVTLDGSEISLYGNELTIRDEEQAVALAGVIGGKNSGVSADTKDIFIESAYFPQAVVRKTSRKLGIETDSAYRFSRGTDPEALVKVLDRACYLMQKLAGGEIASDFYDEYPEPFHKEAITLEKNLLSEKMGFPYEKNQFIKNMKRLSCQVEETETAFVVQAPAFRWDLFYDVDLIEEHIRLEGYDKIPETLPPLVSEPTSHAKNYFIENELGRKLSQQGFLQVINYNFVGDKFQDQFLGKASANEKGIGVSFASESVYIKNPLSEEVNVMRKSLLPGLFRNVLTNYRHGNTVGRLYEMGYCFQKNEDSYLEPLHLAFSVWGKEETLWTSSGKSASKNSELEKTHLIYDLKSQIEYLLTQHLKSNSWQWREFPNEDSIPPFLHPGQCAVLFYEGRDVGFIGTLHPQWRQDEKIREDIVLAEFNAVQLMKGQPRSLRIKPPSKFPPVVRDFAFVSPINMKVGDILQNIQKAGGGVVTSVDVIDIYRGDNLKEGHQSITYRLTYQNSEGTFDEKALSGLQDTIISKVTQKLKIEVRG